jgi:hypothetical protein
LEQVKNSGSIKLRHLLQNISTTQKTSTKATMENRIEGGKQVIVAGNTLEE